MKTKTSAQLEKEYAEQTVSVQTLQKKISQLENLKSRTLTRYRNEKQRVRTHRLIERGAIFESLVTDVEKLTNEQIKALLTAALNSQEAREFLEETFAVEIF